MNKYGVPAQGLKLLVLPKKCDFDLDVKQPVFYWWYKKTQIHSDFWLFLSTPTVCKWEAKQKRQAVSSNRSGLESWLLKKLNNELYDRGHIGISGIVVSLCAKGGKNICNL